MKVYDRIEAFDKDEVEVGYNIKSNNMTVMNDDNKKLFNIVLNPDGSLQITVEDTILLNGVIYDSSIIVQPTFNNQIIVSRPVRVL